MLSAQILISNIPTVVKYVKSKCRQNAHILQYDKQDKCPNG